MRTMGIAVLGLLCTALVVSCGGGGSAPEPRLGDRGAGPRTTLVAALGDSITAGSPLWDPDAAVRDRLGASADPRSQFEYWVHRRDPRVRLRNCGVFGERTDQIARRLDACARGARGLIVQGGINDIAQGRPVAKAAHDLDAMVRRGRSLGLAVALTEVLPWNNGPPGSDRRIRALNARIHAIGRRHHVPVYRWYEQIEDPSIPGQMPPSWTIDGDHPSIEGYRRLAALVRLPGRAGSR